jgi:PAS domain S-box-containing protein
MKSIHLTLKKRFAIIVYIIAILSFILFLTAVNQLRKARAFSLLLEEANALSNARHSIDSMQTYVFLVLPRDLNFFKNGSSKFVTDLKNFNDQLAAKSQNLANNFYLSSDKLIKLKAFSIGHELKDYNNALENYAKYLNQKGFNTYGVNGQIDILAENLINQCRQENFPVLEQKIAYIIELKNQYLLDREPALINKIAIANDEATSFAILTGKYQKLALLSKLQRLNQLITNLSEFDEAIGITNTNGVVGTMNKAKDHFALNASELKDLVNNRIQSATMWGYFWLGLVFIFMIAALFGLRMQLNKFINRPLEKMKRFLAALVKGKLPEILHLKRNDEITDMAVHLNQVVDGLKIKADFAIEIGKGKLDSHFQPLSDDDILGNALIEMEKSLQKADMEDQKYKSEEQKRIWANEGVARFSEILRLHNNDINMLADEIIQNLVNYLNAAQGGLYFFNDESENTYLDLVAAFAYDRKKHIKHSFMLGEGLVGTAALEKEKIFITEIPEEYLTITSGLGEASPRSILLIPLKIEEEVLGVVELASFNIFKPHEIDFVEKIGQTIASTITSVKINARTTKLLEQSQKQAEEMAEQEEEMRQNLEELRTTQEDFARREAEIQGFLNAIQSSTMMLVFDHEGKIIDVNDLFLEALRIKREEMVGRFHKDFSMLSRMGDDLERFWEDLKLGRTKTAVEKIRLSNGKDIYLKQTFSPVLDKNGILFKVLCVSIDVTDAKTAEKLLETNTIELQKVSSNLHFINGAIDNSFLRGEYSIEGRILDLNDKYCQLIGRPKNELVGKVNTHHLSDEEKAEFLEIWANVVSDKPFAGKIKRRKHSGEEVTIEASFVPAKDADGKIQKVFFIGYELMENANA